MLCAVMTAGLAGDVHAAFSTGDLNGPKLRLDYDAAADPSNPVDCFMYFVPLTSPTPVAVTTAAGTTFRARISSWKTTRKGNSVNVACDFEVIGQGVYRASYIPEQLIHYRIGDQQSPGELTKMLEWIRVDGPCLGRIEGKGKIVNGDITMESVEISFNRDNSKSPVQVSIYDIPNVRGQFLFENRKNCQFARINSLTFNRDDDGAPRMAVELDAVKKHDEKEGIFSRLTAMIANVLSTSTPIHPVGNATMMDFGTALYKKEPVFNFPHADNIKESRVSKL